MDVLLHILASLQLLGIQEREPQHVEHPDQLVINVKHMVVNKEYSDFKKIHVNILAGIVANGWSSVTVPFSTLLM